MLTAMIVMLVMTGSTSRDHDDSHSHADDDRDVSSGGYCNDCGSHGDDCGGLPMMMQTQMVVITDSWQ